MLQGMLNAICGGDMFNSIFETLSTNLFSPSPGGAYSAVLTTVQNLHNTVIRPLALLLMFIYFTIAIVDKASQENFTWEQLWRLLGMLLVSKFVIEHGFEILKLCFDIGMAIAADIQAWTGYGGDTAAGVENAEEIINNFKEGLGLTGVLSVLGDLVMFVYLLLPWALAWLIRLCVSVICYTRVIEIYLRATWAPVAMADFFHSGLQGTGARFLKNFLAVCLQGAVILVIAILFSKLMTGITASSADSNLFTFIGKYLAFYASAIMLMFKSLALSKEIVGTN